MRIIILMLTVFWVKVATAQSPQKISYVYDDLSRLSSVTYPNGTQVVYTYDALGNRQTQVITNGACTPPAAPTVLSVTINSGQTASLTASGCSGTVKWYNQQTGGTLLFTGNPYTTSALTTTTTYYASCTVNNCESTTRGSGTVTVNTGCTPPAAPTGIPASRCGAGSVTLGASGCSGTYTWYNGQAKQFVLGTGSSFTSNYTISSYAWVTCTIGSCESVPTGVVATVNTPPSAPTINSPTINSGQTATLTASGCSGTVKWYNQQTSGTLLFTGNPYTTSALTTTTTYYASCTVNNCESTTRGSGTVTVSGSPCPPELIHGTGVLASGTYQASQKITSIANISTPTTYRAGNSIVLSPGFQAGPNESFIAQIGGCTTSTIPTNGLIAYYPFTSNTNDVSGNGNNATNSGATLITDRKGVANSAYYFNGTNAWLNTPMVQANLTGYTISAWVKPEFTANQDYVVLQNRGTTPGSGRSLTLHYQYSTGRWCFAVDGDGIYTGKQAPSPNTTNWVHVVGVWSSGGSGTFNASQFKIYVNGVLLSASSINGNTANIPNTGAGTVALGRHQAWNSYFKGALDDIRVYNRALTDAEVQNIYVIER